MRLHLAINDRFIEHFIQTTISLGCMPDNRFVIYGKPEIPFTKEWDSPNITFVDKLSDFRAVAEEIRARLQVIYIHYLSAEVVEFLDARYISNCKIVWVFWGSDGFSMPEFSSTSGSLNPVSFKVRIARWVAQRSRENELVMKKRALIGKVNYFAHYLLDDMKLFKALLKANPEFVPFCYGITEQLVRPEPVQGTDILLGNSANESNNHLFVFEHMLSSDLMQNIVAPLSYGGSEAYVARVKSAGKRKFGDRLRVLDKKLTADDYAAVLSSAGFAIMYQLRSQAWGNIMQLLYQGSRVFMHPKNTLFMFLRDTGFSVAALEHPLRTGDLIPVSASERASNRAKLLELFGRDRAMENCNKLLSI
jgi:dTDP-N-acetylfucosamine:lipid II N-acetylfucosaminyltransferase